MHTLKLVFLECTCVLKVKSQNCRKVQHALLNSDNLNSEILSELSDLMNSDYILT